MFALVLISGLFLFLPWTALSAMHIESLAGTYRPAEWIVFLFCLSVLILEGGSKGWGLATAHRDIDRRLRHLTPCESGTIEQILAGIPVLQWPHEGAETLHQAGILWRHDGPYPENGQHVYGLTEIARQRAIALGFGKRK